MDDQSIKEIVNEMKPLLVGRSPGKIFQLGRSIFAIDFGLRQGGYLLISVEPQQPRLHLIERRVRDLEKQSIALGPFALSVRKELAATRLTAIEKDPDDRIVRFRFAGIDDFGNTQVRALLIQMTGRSANIFLTDEVNRIIQSARLTTNLGQRVGDVYEQPASEPAPPARANALLDQIKGGDFPTASAAADAYFTSLSQQRAMASRAATARAALSRRISQQQKLRQQLGRDLATHESAAEQKRIGDLLLANLGTATRDGNRVKLIDYFADGAPPVEIELDESVSLQEEATRRFELYSRSKRAVAQIKARQESVTKTLNELEAEQVSLEQQIAAGHLPASSTEASATGREKEKRSVKIPGTRRYVSSEEFEILVGRTANDNDHLTFKVAKPNDLWLHAADYGGSHVVVRNPRRQPVPHRTLVEAAQLAAWFSQAKQDPKVDVHYTERKFVSKIKGGKPGLVRMQRFKSITVEPREAGRRE